MELHPTLAQWRTVTILGSVPLEVIIFCMQPYIVKREAVELFSWMGPIIGTNIKYTMFGKLHQYNDRPAQMCCYHGADYATTSFQMRWYRHDKYYRENDKPNDILENGVRWLTDQGWANRWANSIKANGAAYEIVYDGQIISTRVDNDINRDICRQICAKYVNEAIQYVKMEGL